MGTAVRGEQKPPHGVRICSGRGLPLICLLAFSFGEDRRGAADRNRADRLQRVLLYKAH